MTWQLLFSKRISTRPRKTQYISQAEHDSIWNTSDPQTTVRSTNYCKVFPCKYIFNLYQSRSLIRWNHGPIPPCKDQSNPSNWAVGVEQISSPPANCEWDHAFEIEREFCFLRSLLKETTPHWHQIPSMLAEFFPTSPTRDFEMIYSSVMLRSEAEIWHGCQSCYFWRRLMMVHRTTSLDPEALCHPLRSVLWTTIKSGGRS